MFGKRKKRMTGDEALRIIREKFHGYYVVRYFKFCDMFVFTLLMKEYKQLYTDQDIDVCVNQNGEVINFDYGLIEKKPWRFIWSERRAVYVDKVD